MKVFASGFLLFAALMVGCESKPRPEDAEQIAALIHQADTLGQRVVSQQQTIRYMQNEVRNAATLVAAYEAERNPAKTKPALRTPFVGALYNEPEAIRFQDSELAEVLLSADTTISAATENYGVRAYLVCNGPSDVLVEVAIVHT